jgi:hypothetical protein
MFEDLSIKGFMFNLLYILERSPKIKNEIVHLQYLYLQLFSSFFIIIKYSLRCYWI